jgi:hypothetical protein
MPKDGASSKPPGGLSKGFIFSEIGGTPNQAFVA